ncbi:MAG: hypothetical protein Q7J47_16745 [Azoarcus sp.]|nr:hypothetical protein [Azoarcus sp.]
MNPTMNPQRLQLENHLFQGSGGVSAENRAEGFRPAFFDTQTQCIYPSRFGDGRPAPFHLLDGLPEEVVLARDPGGRVLSVKSTVVSGFVRGGRFFNREEAAAEVAATVLH